MFKANFSQHCISQKEQCKADSLKVLLLCLAPVWIDEEVHGCLTLWPLIACCQRRDDTCSVTQINKALSHSGHRRVVLFWSFERLWQFERLACYVCFSATVIFAIITNACNKYLFIWDTIWSKAASGWVKYFITFWPNYRSKFWSEKSPHEIKPFSHILQVCPSWLVNS